MVFMEIVDHDVHAEALRNFYYMRADASRTDDSERLSFYVPAFESFDGKIIPACSDVSFMYVAR